MIWRRPWHQLFYIAAVGVDGDRSGMSTVALQTPQYADTIATLQREISSLEQEIFTLESLITYGIRSPVPQTGQTIAVQIGDDGDRQAGVAWPNPRFTVNVNAVYKFHTVRIARERQTVRFPLAVFGA